MALSENESGFWTGAAAGAGTGAATGALLAAPTGGLSVAAGALIGAAVGGITYGLLGNDSAQRQRKAREEAAKKAEMARRDQLVKAMGLQNQADTLSMPATKASSATEAKAGQVSGNAGIIGSNVGSSGTF